MLFISFYEYAGSEAPGLQKKNPAQFALVAGSMQAVAFPCPLVAHTWETDLQEHQYFIKSNMKRKALDLEGSEHTSMTRWRSEWAFYL